MEEHEKRQGATRIFRPEKYMEILASTIPDELKCIAEEQQILRIA